MPDAGDAGRSIRKLPDAPWSAHCCARPTVSLQTLERSHEYVRACVQTDRKACVQTDRRAERRACRRTGVQTDRRASLAQTDRHAQEVTAIHRRSLLPLTTLNTTAERKGEGRERRRKIYEGGVHLTQRCGSRVM
jgi:hypothetical protein